MLDAYKITDDTILRRLTTSAELDKLYNFLIQSSQILCPPTPFSKEEFDKVFVPLLEHPKFATWVWINEDKNGEYIIGASILVVRRTTLYAMALSFHREFDVAGSIPQLIEDGRRLLALYGVNHLVFSVDPAAPHNATFAEHFAVTASPPGAPPGSISYEFTV